MIDHNESLSEMSRSLTEILDRLETIPEVLRSQLFKDGQLDRLFLLLAPRLEAPGGSPYEYFLSHKAGLTAIANIRYALTLNYSLRANVEGQQVFLSPDVHQWFDDGVMFLQGREPFTGLIGLYRDGQVGFAVAVRDVKDGEALGPGDFLFIDVETAKKQQEALRAASERDSALHDLEALISARENRESEYQAYFTRYPWVFGAQHTSVMSHVALDDKNIPDYSAARARDGARDVLEIKAPFLPLFRADDEFSAEFNAAWNQAERYLDFTRTESDYLRRKKGLRFETPQCYLIAGHGLTETQRARIQAKERLNASITFLTYEEVLALLRNTLSLVNQLTAQKTAVTRVVKEDAAPEEDSAPGKP